MPSTPPAKSPNYGFLKHLDPALVALGAQAELVFTVDPVACLFRLRLLGERLARELAAHAGIAVLPDEKQIDLLHLLRARGLLHPDVADMFHGLRRTGNRAVHEGTGSASEALHEMKMVRRLGLAVLQTLGRLPRDYSLGPFVPPAAPRDASAELRAELEQLRVEGTAKRSRSGRSATSLRRPCGSSSGAGGALWRTRPVPRDVGRSSNANEAASRCAVRELGRAAGNAHDPHRSSQILACIDPQRLVFARMFRSPRDV